MNNAVILHGKPTRERYENPSLPKPHEANWLPWLKTELEKRDVSASIPALPEPYFPVYSKWKDVFEQEPIDHNTALVGHSAGAEFILRWLSETGASVERVALVAPYHDFDRKYDDFSEYNLDKKLISRVGRISILNSLDDDTPIQCNVERLTVMIPGINLITFKDYGHFRIGHNMRTEHFPELIDELYQ